MDTLRQEKERNIMCGRFYVDEGTAREIEHGHQTLQRSWKASIINLS